MSKFIAAILFVLALVAPMPLAHADDPGACVDDGQTVEYCDGAYLHSLGSTGLDYNPAIAIRVAHNLADEFLRHPTRAEFRALVNRLLQDNAQGKCMDNVPCDPKQISAEQAVFIVQRAIIIYGPPGLSDTLDRVMTAQ